MALICPYGRFRAPRMYPMAKPFVSMLGAHVKPDKRHDEDRPGLASRNVGAPAARVNARSNGHCASNVAQHTTTFLLGYQCIDL